MSRLHRFRAAAPGLGARSVGAGGVEYRMFLTNSLLERAELDVPEPRLVSSAVREAVERFEWWATGPEPASPPGRTLLRPAWDGDDQAEVLARRDPINDGSDAPDSYIWLDSLGRMAATTEASYRLWRSRLTHPTSTNRGWPACPGGSNGRSPTATAGRDRTGPDRTIESVASMALAERLVFL